MTARQREAQEECLAKERRGAEARKYERGEQRGGQKKSREVAREDKRGEFERQEDTREEVSYRQEGAREFAGKVLQGNEAHSIGAYHIKTIIAYEVSVGMMREHKK